MKLDLRQNEKKGERPLSTLNHHHLNFFKVINHLTNAIDQKQDGPYSFYYNELVDFIDAYFDEQEEHLFNIKHPRLDEHRALHRIFSQGMARLLILIDENGMNESNLKRTRLIVEELINHIMISDQNL